MTNDHEAVECRFAVLFDGVAPSLHAWAALRASGPLRRRLEPEDLVQEIAVRAYQRIDDFDPDRGSFRQWIFGFAQRVWLEVLRELGRDPLSDRRRQGGDSQLDALPDSVTAISQRIAKEDTLRASLARLEELSDDDRRLVASVGLEGLSHADAALVLAISEESCRKRWQRLRARLSQDPVLRSLHLCV